MSFRNLRVMIAGYFGAGNIGDELLLHTLIGCLAESGAEMTVVSMNPEHTRAHHFIEAVSYDDFPGLARKMSDVDAVVLGGGGLFQDHHRFTVPDLYQYPGPGVAYFAQVCLLARQLGIPTILWAMGVGPLKTQEARNITREVFLEAYAVSVRDKASADLLREIGITRDFPVAADPAWMVEMGPSHGLPIEQRFPELAGKKVLAMILREWYLVQGWEERLAEALRAAVPSTWGCLWLPFQDVSDHLDRASFERIIAKVGCGTHAVWQGLSFEDVPGALSHADAAFAMRLHGVILAGQAGLPTAVFQYDDKVTSAADMIGIDEEWRVRFDDPPEKIAQVLKSVLAAADVSGALRPLKTADLGRDALQHKRFILETLSALAEIPQKKRGWAIAKFDWLLAWQREREGRASQFEGLTRNLLNREEQVQILSRDLADRKQELRGVEAQLVDRNRQVAELSHDLTERVRRIADLSEKALGLEKQRDELNNTLNEIWASRSWQVVKILRGIRQWTIPRGSRRAAFSRTMWRGVQVGRQGGVGALSRKFWGWALKGRIMNWYAFAFDSYKRARLSVHAADLRSLRAPSEPGLVSVVLPAFNGAHLLREALESILVQTYPKFEVIAINDGSTDETGAILDEYARRDSRIHVIHQENRKIPRTLSRGFCLARGEFLTWTSVDNRLAPDFIEQMVSCLRRHPDWDMAYSNLDIIDEDGKPLTESSWYSHYQRPPGSEHIFLPEDPSELNIWPNNYVGGAFLYRDRVAWLIGDYSSLRFTTEDYDYWMRVNALMKLRHTDFAKPVYEYRFHRQSLTHRDEEFGITEGRKFLMVFDDFRRNFSLGPVTWIVDAGSSDGSGAELRRQLEQHIQGAGHNLLPKMTFSPESLPRLWFPSVYVRLTDTPGAIGSPPPGLPRNSLKVVLTANAGHLPAEMSGEWDLCLTSHTSGPLPRLERPYQGWLGGNDVKQLFTAIDIRVRSKQLEAIEAEIAQAETRSPLKLAVIICTHRRSRRLPKAIASVAKQTLPLGDYEVVVVNNDPLEDYPETIVNGMRREFFQDFPDHIRLIRCLTPGLSHARNAGISEARGGILAFIDDDAIAQPDCLEKVLRAFEEHPEVGVVGGHIRLKMPEPRPEALLPGWERYWSQFLTDYQRYTEVEHWWEFPWGANWSARRKALLEIGGFRANYGRRGNDFGGGEELVAASLMKQLGYRIAIVPGAEVIHDVEEDRYSFEHIKRTIAAAALVNYRIQKDLYVPMESSLLATRREIGSAFQRLLTGIWGGIRRSGGSEKEETAYILRARLMVVKRQIQDFFHRFRRPVTRD